MASLNPEQTEAIRSALAEGQMLQAIKLYRDATGAGLKESKDFITALSQRLIEEDPEQFARLSSTQGGCGTVVLLTTLILIAGGSWALLLR